MPLWPGALQKSKRDAHRLERLSLRFSILVSHMKTLVILAHPNISESKINSAWINGANAPGQATIRNIYEIYPDGKIDVEVEQSLILSHDAILLQFPLYWFNVPPLLKQWLDDVLTPGFAYGSNTDDRKLTGIPIGFAVSAGIQSDDYRSNGRGLYTVKEFLAPLHATAHYIGAKTLEPFIFYGAEHSPSEADVAASVEKYLGYLMALKNSQLPEFVA